MATHISDGDLDSAQGYVDRLDMLTSNGSVVPISFTIVDSNDKSTTGSMHFDMSSPAANSYAIIFTMAMTNGYEVVVARKAGDTLYSSVQLLQPDLTESVAEGD